MSMANLVLPAQGYGLVSSPGLIYRSLKPRRMHVDSRWIWTGPTIQHLSQQSTPTKTFVLTYAPRMHVSGRVVDES
jgi:hypothetical protein